MKIKIFKGLTFVLILSLFFFSCQKVRDDKIPPVIKPRFDVPIALTQSCTNINQSILKTIVVTDDHSIDTIYYETALEIETANKYWVKFIAVDSDGNFAYETYEYIVGPVVLEDLVGDYKVLDKIVNNTIKTNYTSKISPHSDDMNKFNIHGLNNRDTGFVVTCSFNDVGAITCDSTYYSDTLLIGDGFVTCIKDSLVIDYRVLKNNLILNIHHAVFTTNTTDEK
nr:hypothetical protein [Bacteroidota bacterium]